MIEIEYNQEWFICYRGEFNSWFDKDKFDYNFCDYLCRYCWRQFDKWFDPKTYNWEESSNLCQTFPKQFDKWFDPDLFNWMHIMYLVMHLSDRFEDWLTVDHVSIKIIIKIYEECNDKIKIITWINNNIPDELKLQYINAIK